MLTPRHVIFSMLATWLFFLEFPAWANTELYVATNGNDHWTGRLPAPNLANEDGPFATLDRARDELRTLKTRSLLTNASTVFVRGGIYYRTNTLFLYSFDGGTADAQIYYRAFTNETPVLNGGLPITNFLPWQGQAFKAQVGAQGFSGIHFRQLFINGHRQQLARYPNYVSTDPIKAGWSYVAGTTTNMYASLPSDSQNSFTYKPGDVRTWAHPEKAQVSIFPRYNWGNNNIKISSINTSTHLITLSGNADFAIRAGDRYFVNNVFEELDTPGEWYLDDDTWTLYFWPSYPTTNLVICAPTIDTILSLGAANTTFQGFTFEAAAGNAINLTWSATNCIIAGCTIRNVGGLGIVGHGGYKNGVIGNDIYATGDGGIILEGGDRSTLTPSGHYADNNWVHHTGVLNKRPAAIAIGGVGNRASRNLIHDCPHYGIALGGNNNTAESNVVHHVNLETDDTGAIVTNGYDWIYSRGNVIRYNYIYDIQGFGFRDGQYFAPYYAWGIYLDDGAAAVDVIGNIVVDCSKAAINLHNARDNRIVNNIFLNCGAHQVSYNGWRSTDTMWLNYLPGMIAGYDSVSNQPSWQAMRGMNLNPLDAVLPGGLIMASNQFVLNIIAYTNSSAELYAMNYVPFNANHWRSNIVYHYGQPIKVGTNYEHITFAAWQALGRDPNSIVADPLFVNASARDFRLQPGSPALTMGFQTNSMGHFGLYQSPLRASWPVVEGRGTLDGYPIEPPKSLRVIPSL